MYVISSRPERVAVKGGWSVLYSGNGLPPATISPQQPHYLSAGFISSITDPLVIVIHGYNNLETDAFGTYATVSGTYPSTNSLVSHGFPGSVVGFDWPSSGSHSPALWKQLGVYQHDLDAAQQSGVPALVDFVDRLTNRLAGTGIRVNLVAHSMGNFVMSRMLMAKPELAEKLDNIVSFAPDMLQSDLERPELIAAADSLVGNWFVYWAQADVLLLTGSDWANIFLGNERWQGRRLGQEGPPSDGQYSKKVIGQCWDVPLAKQMGSTYNWDLKEWPFNMKIHGLYWSNGPFLDNVAANLGQKPGAKPVIADWPMPGKPS